MKGFEITRARSVQFLTPHTGGSKLQKIVIVPERGAWLLYPLDNLFLYVFGRGIHCPHAAVFTFPASGDVDAFLGPYSHSWYVHFPHLKLFLCMYLHYFYRSRIFLRIYGEYFLFYEHVSVNLPLLPLPLDSVYSARLGIFLGGLYV